MPLVVQYFKKQIHVYKAESAITILMIRELVSTMTPYVLNPLGSAFLFFGLTNLAQTLTTAVCFH